MAEKFNTVFLGTTKKLRNIKSGCLFTFSYTARGATDPYPFIIMTSHRWRSEKGGNYMSGVNLNKLRANTRQMIIDKFGGLPIGSVSYRDIQAACKSDPGCCFRTYNVRNVRALHKVEVPMDILEG